MTGKELLEAVSSYPQETEWSLFDGSGPSAVWDEPCGCTISWVWWEDTITPKIERCADLCISWGEQGTIGHCIRCGHSCQQMRPPTFEEAETYVI